MIAMNDRFLLLPISLRSILLTSLLTLLAMSNLAIAADSPQRQFQAGAYAIDITPLELPVIVNGGMLSRTTDTIVDRLHARCLVLDDGETKIAIVAVDSCVLPRHLLDNAKEMASKATGIPTDRMLISATHTHTAPSVTGALGTPADEKYAAFLPGQIAKGITMANANLAPARIGWGVKKDPRNVFVRRFLMKPGKAPQTKFTATTNDRARMNPGYGNPDAVKPLGVPDTDVWVLSVQTKEGRPLALLANYSTHYAGSKGISADYFGVFCELMAKHFEDAKSEDDPPFMAMLSNGTSGDANCLNFLKTKRDFNKETVARDVAETTQAVLGDIKYFDWAPLVMAESKLTFDIRKTSDEETAEAQKVVDAFTNGLPRTTDEVYALETTVLHAMPAQREVKLQALRIGDLGITAMPAEVYSETGLAIKRLSPLPATFNTSLANGWSGYIPPPEQRVLGGYTTWRGRTCLLEAYAEPKIRTEILRLLRTVDEQRRDESPIAAE